MNTHRETEHKGGRINPAVRCRHRIVVICSSFNDPPSPPYDQKEDEEDQQRVKSVNLGYRRICPKRARKRHQQSRSDCGREYEGSRIRIFKIDFLPRGLALSPRRHKTRRRNKYLGYDEILIAASCLVAPRRK